MITQSRKELQKGQGNFGDRKQRYAREDIKEEIKELLDIVKKVQPTVLIGLTGKGKIFNKEVLQEMAKVNEHPIIFALSNPEENSECTAQEV